MSGKQRIAKHKAWYGVWSILPITLLFMAGLNLATAATISNQPFGKLPDGKPVEIYTLKTEHGTTAKILTFGALLQSFVTPDRKGAIADIVLGYDNLNDYVEKNQYFGHTAGRYANRIANGKFSLNGKSYSLAINDPPNTLHGGKVGFDRALWKVIASGASAKEAHVVLRYISADGEEGYPGELTATVTYTLTETGELRFDYAAASNADTVINLTNHSYWNLSGEGSGDVLQQRLMVNADRYTPVNASLIPTGELQSVAGTPFDFRQPRALVEGVRNGTNQQITYGRGYDHNFVLRRALDAKDNAPRLAAQLVDPKSGRVMEVRTTEPGIQIYTGNILNGTIPGKGGKLYRQGDAICLETQHFPDSANQPAFPTTVLKAGEKFASTTVYRFSVNK